MSNASALDRIPSEMLIRKTNKSEKNLKKFETELSTYQAELSKIQSELLSINKEIANFPGDKNGEEYSLLQTDKTKLLSSESEILGKIALTEVQIQKESSLFSKLGKAAGIDTSKIAKDYNNIKKYVDFAKKARAAFTAIRTLLVASSPIFWIILIVVLILIFVGILFANVSRDTGKSIDFATCTFFAQGNSLECVPYLVQKESQMIFNTDVEGNPSCGGVANPCETE